MLNPPSPRAQEATPVFSEIKIPELGSREVPTLRKLSRIFSNKDSADRDDDEDIMPELEADELIESDHIGNHTREGDISFGTSDSGRSGDDSGYEADGNGHVPVARNNLETVGLVGPRYTGNDSLEWITTSDTYADPVGVDESTVGTNGDEADDEKLMNEKFKEPILAEFKRVPLPVLLLREQEIEQGSGIENAEVINEARPAKSSKSKVSLPHLHDAISLLWAIDVAAFDADQVDVANTSFASSVSVVDVSMNDKDWWPVDYQPDFDFQVAMDSWAWEDVPSQMLDYVVGNRVPRRVVLGGLQYFFREYRKIRED
ncbi:uncharacterized protein V1513DRAFT_381490 [Lipomyces chichibuensis]|uniref:uncharacterized protein n=1 Tax=Lipomyces chichibuensis TaxID=1546026 RepID=UPI003343A3DC